MKIHRPVLLALSSAWLSLSTPVLPQGLAADTPAAVTHAFLATGGETYIRDGRGKVTWRYPHASRDGWVLPDGQAAVP